ncbi:UNVERIFIED_CONTAM: hypothetical protein Sindi_3110300 [Sesamum indicum]
MTYLMSEQNWAFALSATLPASSPDLRRSAPYPNLGVLVSSNTRVDLCSLCINTKESARHLFFECPFSSFVWSRIRHWIGISRTMSTLQSATKWLKKEKIGSSVQNKARHLALACTVYTLWRHRNEVIFEGSTPCPEGLIRFVKVTLYRVLWTLFPHGLLV